MDVLAMSRVHAETVTSPHHVMTSQLCHRYRWHVKVNTIVRLRSGHLTTPVLMSINTSESHMTV